MAMDFEQMGKLMQLAQKLDMEKVMKLASKVDLGELIGLVAQMEPAALAQMTRMMKKSGNGKAAELPEITSDFFDMASLLDEEQQALRTRVRTFMEEQVAPIANEYWMKDEFPMQLIEGIRDLRLGYALWDEHGNRKPGSYITDGIIAMEMARTDVSVATFNGVHGSLAGWSIALGGSEAQRKQWLPLIMDYKMIGAFGLTEPNVGSGTAGGLTTTCRREGDGWVLNGQKKWIGNATFADFTVIWAREEETGHVQGFLVRRENPGFSVEKLMGKIALRTVENGLITLTECRVPEEDRLQAVQSWRTVADVLRATRAGVAWFAVGCAMGAYERALKYSRERRQFGRPIGAFQLTQQKLATMIGNITAMQTMCFRLSQLQEAGVMRDEQASLAKMYAAAKCRETVALARDMLGGNGLLLEYDVARFFADAEAIYSYEGTNEMNALIVGRAVTGYSAFV